MSAGNRIQGRICELVIRTSEGEFIAGYSAKGLCALEFPSGAKGASDSGSVPPQVRRWHAVATKALTQALDGQTPKSLPPLDLTSGTEFQQRVWSTLRKISLGGTWSYGEVAQAMGQPKAVRAVGGACGRNPIPVFVPCHRVVAANQGLGGFSADLNWKRTLLEREGIKSVY